MVRWVSILAVAAALGGTGAAGEQAMKPTDLAAEVRATEIAFARTMADRDHAAFTSFLADEAVFLEGGGALRGKAAIAAAWSRYYEGDAAPFSWAPASVEVLASGTLAFSTGPVRDPSGKCVATFNSVWRRRADGDWKIVFDKGSPACESPPTEPGE